MTTGHAQLALDYQGARSDDGAGIVLDDDDVVALLLDHALVLGLKLVLGDVADRGQDAQAVEETGIVVGAAQGPQLVTLGQRSRDVGGDEVRGEEALVGGHGGKGRGAGDNEARHWMEAVGDASWRW